MMMINKIGLVMGIIGLILSITWGALYYNQKAETKALLAKSEQDLVVLEKAAKLREDSISLEIRKRDSVNKSLLKAQVEAKESLNESIKLSKSLSADLRRAKADRDTIKYYAKCDSLADQVTILEAENASYQNKVDLLNLSYAKQLADKDTLLAARGRLYSELRQSYSGSILREDQLKDNNRKLELQLQKARRTSRVVAVIGAAVAGTIYLVAK
jgi:hypothetical protein